MCLNVYFFRLFIDFTIGMKTNAPDIRIVMMRGPSILVFDVMTIAHNATQNKAKMIHWLFDSGLRMIFVFKLMILY